MAGIERARGRVRGRSEKYEGQDGSVHFGLSYGL